MKTPKQNFILSTTLDNVYDRQLIEGVADFAREHPDCAFTLIRPESLPASIASRRPDGVICPVLSERLSVALSARNIPVVDLFSRSNDSAFSAVGPDNISIGRLAAEHFIERRFVNFAFFGYRGVRYSEMRREGFLARLAESDFTAEVFESAASPYRQRNDNPFGYLNVPTSDAVNLVRQLRTLDNPVAVFCCHDPRAVAVLGACRRAAIPVPDNVAILGVDDDTVSCSFASPRLSSIDLNTHRIGYEAARLLVRIAQGGKPVREVLTIPPHGISVRESSEIYPIQPQWLSDALIYIQHNATRGISACDVFTALGLSHTLAQRVFREKLKTTVQQQIVAARMAHAKRLLKTTALPIGEVAKKSGFASLHYFSQTFSALTGQAPQVWRQRVGDGQ